MSFCINKTYKSKEGFRLISFVGIWPRNEMPPFPILCRVQYLRAESRNCRLN